MPAKYEHIRDRLLAKGMEKKVAEMHAAKIYNATRKAGQAPVVRGDK